jgi:eukaryotic-like serine/threonine-protein kinase
MLGVGTVIDERYRLEALIGEGGMGVVFEATHLGLGRAVAIKVVRSDRSGDDAATRLVREARIVGTLRSRHVAQILDVGTHDGEPFLVMERLHGRTVQEVVISEGPLAIETVADIVIQACHALDDAHRHGVVHRDIKPSNLFLASEDGEPPILKVIDFGISKSLPLEGAGGHAETKTGTLLGSPAFMSPEQIRSARDVDARTDVWSLGIVLYFLATGKRPFAAESLLDLMTGVVHETPAPMGSLRADAEALEKIVLRCLEKDREDRFPTAAELAHELAPHASAARRELALSMSLERAAAAPLSSRRPLVESVRSLERKAPAEETHTETLSASVTAPLPSSTPPKRTKSKLAAVVAALGVVAIGSAGLVFARHRTPAVAAPEPPASMIAPGASGELGSEPREPSTVDPAPKSANGPESARGPESAGSAPPSSGARPQRKRPHPPPSRPKTTEAKPVTTEAAPRPPEIPKTPD